MIMDRVLRNYAQTAWTPADPLVGLDPHARRAILLMPSTFRERWKLAPWTTREQRRLAVQNIVAERRLMYELTHRDLAAEVQQVAPSALAPPPTEPDSPYYRYRLGLHQRTVDAMAQTRSSQDKHDFATLAEAKVDLEYRRARRMALLDIEFERERLDLLEAEIENGGLPNLAASGHPTLTVAPTKKKVRERAR